MATITRTDNYLIFWLPQHPRPALSLFRKKLPRILFALSAFKDTQHLIQIAAEKNTELTWLGVVRRNRKEETYLVKKIILFRQEVSGGYCEISAEDLARWAQKFAAEAGELRFWGHFHPFDSVLPSQVDEQQMEIFSYSSPFFIRGIYTKERSCLTFFDYEHDLIIENPPVGILTESDKLRQQQLRDEVNKKVSTVFSPPLRPTDESVSHSWHPEID